MPYSCIRGNHLIKERGYLMAASNFINPDYLITVSLLFQ